MTSEAENVTAGATNDALTSFVRRSRRESSVSVEGCISCDSTMHGYTWKQQWRRHCCGSERNLSPWWNWWSKSSASPLKKGVLIRTSADGSGALCGLLTKENVAMTGWRTWIAAVAGLILTGGVAGPSLA